MCGSIGALRMTTVEKCDDVERSKTQTQNAKTSKKKGTHKGSLFANGFLEKDLSGELHRASVVGEG